MTYSVEDIAEAIDTVEALAAIDRRGNYEPVISRLETELRIAARAARQRDKAGLTTPPRAQLAHA